MLRRRRTNLSAVEPLEVRALLSTITVTSLADNVEQDGEVTLREAIQAANDDASVDGSEPGSGVDVIKFDSALAGGTITLGQGELAITSSLTIDGTHDRIVISNSESGDIFEIGDVESVRLSDLEFVRVGARMTGDNGTVYSQARSLKMNRVKFFEDENAAAIYVGQTGPTTVEFKNSQFVSSSSVFLQTSYSGPNVDVQITGSRFIDNTGHQSFIGGRTNIVVEDSSFIGNEKLFGTTLLFGAKVSGSEFIRNRAHTIASLHSVSDTIFHENTVNGHVLTLYQKDGETAQVTDTTVSDNKWRGAADNEYAVRLSSCSDTSPVSFLFQRVRVEGNRNNGLGVQYIRHCKGVHIEDSVVANNAGNGIDIQSGTSEIVITRSTISDNELVGVTATNLQTYGSTIAGNLDGGIATEGVSTFVNSTISGNHGFAIDLTPDYNGEGSARLLNTTVFGNILDPDRPAINNASIVRNSIVAGNATLTGDAFDLQTPEHLESWQINNSLIGVNTGNDLDAAPPGNPDADGNIVGTANAPVDPILGALGDNGGPTLTHAITSASPARDAGKRDPGVTDDQTGKSRPVGASPDMGAFEFDPNSRHLPDVVLSAIDRPEDAGVIDVQVAVTDTPADGESLRVRITTEQLDGVYGATEGTDYNFTPVTLTFESDGPSMQTVSIELINDDMAERNQVIKVNAEVLSGETRDVMPSIRPLILNEDFSTISVKGKARLSELDSEFVFELQLDNDVEEPFSISAITEFGKATAEDFEAIDTNLEFSGDSEDVVELRIPIVNDDLVEVDEVFRLLFSENKPLVDLARTIIQPVIDSEDLGADVRDRILFVSTGDGADTVTASEANDVLTLNVNGDTTTYDMDDIDRIRMQTQAGPDMVRIDAAIPSRILAGNGYDTIFGSLANDSIEGGGGNDVITARGSGDTVYAQAGNDRIFGSDNRDRLYGGEGRDKIRAEGGNDYINGGSGDDSLLGGPGSDAFDGGTGKDTIRGGGGNDRIDGGAGDDSLFGDDGSDLLTGEDGHDSLYGGNQRDSLWGRAGDDWIEGGSGPDNISDVDATILGGDGNDWIRGTNIDGQAGNDRIFAHTDSQAVTLTGGRGNDTIIGGDYDDVLSGGYGHDSIEGGDGDDSIEGGRHRDTLLGQVGDDTLSGNGDSDFLEGDVGHDVLDGGSGKDALFAGPGDDTLSGAGSSDLLSASRLVFGDSYNGRIRRERVLDAWRSDDDYADRIAAAVAIMEERSETKQWKGRDGGADVFLADPSIDWLHHDTGTDTFDREDEEDFYELQ